MDWFTSFFHPEKAYQAGQDTMSQFYNQAQGYQAPYNQYGQNAYQGLSDAMQALLNPEALHDKWVGNYEQSETSKRAQDLATQSGLNAASSLGLMGSSPALSAIQEGTTQIGLADRDNYLNSLLQKYLAGTGIATNVFNTGAQSASQMANNAMKMGEDMAQMKYGEQAAGGNMLANLLGLGLGFGSGAYGNSSWNFTGGR